MLKLFSTWGSFQLEHVIPWQQQFAAKASDLISFFWWLKQDPGSSCVSLCIHVETWLIAETLRWPPRCDWVLRMPSKCQT
jgi:hypothetical protein